MIVIGVAVLFVATLVAVYVFLFFFLLGTIALTFVLFVVYLVAFIFHIACCGLLFRFVGFTPYSCFVGKCGLPVDRGGPDGLGFSHGRVGFKMIGGGGGGGGGRGDGDGGWGDGGGGGG